MKKKQFLTSYLVLALTLVLLLGTTAFAWFTDTATSAPQNATSAWFDLDASITTGDGGELDMKYDTDGWSIVFTKADADKDPMLHLNFEGDAPWPM